MDSTAVVAERAFKNPIRQLTSVTASVEKSCLVWMANRLPLWVTSDHLTSLALGGMVAAGLSYWMASVTQLGFFGATLGLLVNWFGDSLDGTLARVRHAERPRYGFYVDHVVDIIGIACLLGGLGLSGYMSPIVAIAVLAAYLMLSAEIFLRTSVLGTFRMSFFGIGPTELRMVIIAGGFMVMGHPTTIFFGHVIRVLDIGGIVGAVGLVATFLISAADGTRTLYLAEPLPKTNPDALPNADATLAMMGR